jgi:pilus assembly protein CpaC
MLRQLIVAFSIFAAGLCWAADDETVELYVGEIKILKVADIKRMAVGNSKLLSTSLLNNGQLLIIAEGEGDSNVHIWFNNGTERDITVHIKNEYGTLEQKAEIVRTLLAGVTGLEVRVIGDRIVLSGNVPSNTEAAITTVAGVYKEIMDLTTKDVLDLPVNKMVFMNVKITEFNRNYLENLGIVWDKVISGPSAAVAWDPVANNQFRVTPPTPSFSDLLPRSATSPLGYFGIASEISSRINLAVNSGNGVILAEPRLATRSGGEATFLAGGEVPYQVTNSLGASNVEFKEFGIQLTLKPEVDANNNIRANVSTEVSAIDNSVAVQGVPGFLTRRTSTDVSMKSGETLVISGLINQQASKDINKLAFLGDIPILGELFKSKSFRDQKSELVIFVTPTVYDAKSELNQSLLQDRKQGLDKTIEAIGEKSLNILD